MLTSLSVGDRQLVSGREMAPLHLCLGRFTVAAGEQRVRGARVMARGLLYRVRMEMTRPEAGMDREETQLL